MVQDWAFATFSTQDATAMSSNLNRAVEFAIRAPPAAICLTISCNTNWLLITSQQYKQILVGSLIMCQRESNEPAWSGYKAASATFQFLWANQNKRDNVLHGRLFFPRDESRPHDMLSQLEGVLHWISDHWSTRSESGQQLQPVIFSNTPCDAIATWVISITLIHTSLSLSSKDLSQRACLHMIWAGPQSLQCF